MTTGNSTGGGDVRRVEFRSVSVTRATLRQTLQGDELVLLCSCFTWVDLSVMRTRSSAVAVGPRDVRLI